MIESFRLLPEIMSLKDCFGKRDSDSPKFPRKQPKLCKSSTKLLYMVLRIYIGFTFVSLFFPLVYETCVLLIELFSYCLERNNVCTRTAILFSFSDLFTLLSSENSTFNPWQGLPRHQRHRSFLGKLHIALIESQPEGLPRNYLVSVRNELKSEREMESGDTALDDEDVLVLQFHIVHQFSLVLEYFFPFGRTQNKLLKKIRKALKIKRNIHNKLPLTRSLLLSNVFWGEKKNASLERKSRKVFFVYTIWTELFVSINILKINGHDFVMRFDLEGFEFRSSERRFALAQSQAQSRVRVMSWLVGILLELRVALCSN